MVIFIIFTKISLAKGKGWTPQTYSTSTSLTFIELVNLPVDGYFSDSGIQNSGINTKLLILIGK